MVLNVYNMKKYRLTLPRTLLFAVLLIGGIVYYTKNGFDAMSNAEVVLSMFLLVALFLLIVLKIIGALKKKT